ncbi:MAG TPA: YkgJ family cysteine cluster protein [Thermoanaerobaculaceae bacterium]|nr:YkgJ family cysteine cluster protein [Thermoanaerobaculaceae bacterium]
MARTVLWALPGELVAADAVLVGEFDATIRGGEEAAGRHLACRLGCTHCCVGPFDITALDAARLVRGLEALAGREPALAEEVRRRARQQWARFAGEFPGDDASGALADDEAARQAFFERFADLPCAALDPADGRCNLYADRPLTCRSFGLPVRVGAEVLPACALNFTAASDAERLAATVEPDPDDAEGRLLARLAAAGGPAADTIVAAALALGHSGER